MCELPAPSQAKALLMNCSWIRIFFCPKDKALWRNNCYGAQLPCGSLKRHPQIVYKPNPGLNVHIFVSMGFHSLAVWSLFPCFPQHLLVATACIYCHSFRRLCCWWDPFLQPGGGIASPINRYLVYTAASSKLWKSNCMS